MKAPVEGTEFYEYTLMPTHMQRRFSPEELQNIELQEPFSFTKGCRTLKIKAQEAMNNPVNFGTKLFCLKEDPNQEHPQDDIVKETELANEMIRMMHEDECPKERFTRFGFPAEGMVTEEDIRRLRDGEIKDRIPESLKNVSWEKGAVNMYYAIQRFVSKENIQQAEPNLLELTAGKNITVNHMMQWIGKTFPAEQQPLIFYFAMLASRTE